MLLALCDNLSKYRHVRFSDISHRNQSAAKLLIFSENENGFGLMQANFELVVFILKLRDHILRNARKLILKCFKLDF